MFSVHDTGARLCDGISRREILRAGGLGLFGLSSSAYHRQQVAQAAGTQKRDGKAKACIVLFLMGGPPQHSTWDPKPDAPAEVRGEIAPIATKTPGIQFGELMPRLAQHSDRLAVLRAMATDDNAHSSSGYAMLTGTPHIPKNRENANPGAPNNWPNIGAVLQHLQPGRRLMPPAIRLPNHIFNTDQSIWPGQDAGFLGHTAEPWLFSCDPAAANFEIPHFKLSSDVTLGRLNQRESLLKQLEGRLSALERGGTQTNYSDQREQAFALLGAPKARQACNLELESTETRDRYGRSQFGQSVLLARRLVEAGVSLIQVNWYRGPDEPADNPCWDSHTNETERLKTVLTPPMDQAYAALLDDLIDRGMLDETLIVCMGEFGRTPRFNARAGRDHWGHVFSVSLAGGGIRGGAVHGSSDPAGAYPREGRVEPQDLTATIFHCLGYEPGTEIHDPLGRPLPISRGRVVSEIL